MLPPNGINFCKSKHRSNACLFSKHEIRNHIRQLKDLYPFNYKVLDRVENGVQIIAVYLNLKNVPVLFHKYILTWVRYLYEFPYNVLLRDAYWLKEDPQFRFQALSRIFNIVTYCNKRYVGEGHSISEAHLHVPMTKKDLRERIAEAIKLNDIYEALDLKYNEVPYIIEKFSNRDIEYWSREFFDTIRKPVYINLFNQIK